MERTTAHHNTGQHMAAMGVILLAMLLFTCRLRDIPYGLHHDEMFNLVDMVDVLHGRLSLYFPANYGREPLFTYSAALVAKLAHADLIWSHRLTSVLWALLGLVTTFPLARRLGRPTSGVYAVALMAGSFWMLMTARAGLRAISLLPFANLTAIALAWGISKQGRASWRAWILAGVLAGLAQYSYLAARALFLAPLIGMIASLIYRRPQTRRDLLETVAGPLLMLLFTGAIFAPLYVYMQQTPAPARLETLDAPLRAALAGQWRPLLSAILETLGALFWRGPEAPNFALYNIPGRPALSYPLVALFLIGFLRALIRPKDQGSFLTLTMFTIGILPDLLSSGGPLFLRGIIALPYIFFFVADGAWALVRFSRRLGRPAAFIVAMLVVALLPVHYVVDTRAYFTTWAQRFDTFRIYNGDLRALADFAPQSQGARRFVSTDFWLDLDQQTYAFLAPHPEGEAWFNAALGIPLPKEGGADYAVLSSTPPLPTPIQAILDQASAKEYIPSPWGTFDAGVIYHLSQHDQDKALGGLALSPLPQAVSFGDALLLMESRAYQQRDEVFLLTLWHIQGESSSAGPVRLSAQIQDASGFIYAQSDPPVAYAFQSWRAGDRFLQVHRIPLPADIAPGTYAIRLSAYSDPTQPLPMHAGTNFLRHAPQIAQVDVLPLAGEQSNLGPPPFEGEPSATDAGLRLAGAWDKPAEIIAGVPLVLHLRWTAATDISPDSVHFRAALLSQQGNLLWEGEAAPLQRLPDPWPAGLSQRLAHTVVVENLPAHASEMPVDLEICGYLDTEMKQACWRVPGLRVRNPERFFTPPVQTQVPLDAEWPPLALRGITATTDQNSLSLVLLWQVRSSAQEDIIRFVHLVDDAGAILAQEDRPLTNAGLPPRAWFAGEYFTDTLTLALPPDSHPTALRIGLYWEESGERLDVMTAKPGTEEDRSMRLPLSSLEVEGILPE